MKKVRVELVSMSAYSQSRKIVSEAGNKEQKAEFEKRVWRERMHCDDSGECFIPPMQFKKSVEIAAKFLRMRIPEKDRSEYGKHFRAGILVTEPLMLGVSRDDVKGEWLYVSSKGTPGGARRVMKCFPYFPSWKGIVTFHVLDDTITEDVFEKHLIEAGNFVGIGRFRPERGGFYGRYQPKSFDWSNGSIEG